MLAAAAPYHSDAPEASVRWRTIRTDHFAIHYMASDRRGRPIGAEPFAQALAAGADTVLLDAAEAMGQVPIERLHVVVLDSADDVEGYTLPHWDWIVLSAHPGTQLARTRGRSDGPLDALAHEVGHILSHKASVTLPERLNLGVEVGGSVEGPWGGAGGRVELDHDRPYGWSEGVAEWISERAGVNTWTAERDAVLRVTALEDRWLTWAELQTPLEKGDFGDAERAYQQGYAFARWLAERYGPEVHGQVAAAKGLRGWDGALAQVTGVRGQELHARFIEERTAHYRAQAEAIAEGGLAEGREVISWRPPWWPDGRWGEDRWAERTPRDREDAREATGSWRLCPRLQDGWLLEGRVGWVVASRVDEAALPGIAGAWPALSTSAYRETQGKERLWIPGRFGRGFAHGGVDQIYVVGPTHGDGALLDGVDFDRIWRVDLSGGIGDDPREAQRRRTAVPGTERASDIAVSPDGTTLAWLQAVGGGQRLWVGPVDGSAWRTLDAWGTASSARGLSWSPDGQRLVTSRMVAGQVDLWTVGVAEGDWAALTDDGHVEQDPWWDAEGVWFVADPDGVQDAYRLADGAVTRVTGERRGAQCPSTTPGGHLLYSAPTAYGMKAVALGRWAMHGEASEAFTLDVDAEQLEALRQHPGPPPMESRPYRAVENLLPPSLGPFVRVDVSGRQVSPSVGAYATVSDAVEHHDLSLWGMVGDDRAAQVRYAWQQIWPELGVWGSTVRERVRVDGPAWGRGLDRGAVFAARAVTSSVEVELEAQALRLTRDDGLPRLDGLRGTAAVSVDTLSRDLDAEGVELTVGWTVAQSVLDGVVVDQREALSTYRWHRPWAQGRWNVGLGPGPADAPHRLELRWGGGWTSRHVFSEEQFAAGGETPWALRNTALETTLPLPGYAPYAVRGDALALAGAAWALPVGVRWRAGGRGFFVRRVEGLVGVDGGAVWRTDGGAWTLPAPVGDVRAGLRLASVLRDSRFDSQLIVAAPVFGGERAAATGPVPAAAGWTGPVRVVLGVGTGW